MISVFVDVARTYNALTRINVNARLDYKRYLEKAVGSSELHKAFAYGVHKDGEADSFISVLRDIGYEPRYRRARIFQGEQSISLTTNNIIMTVDIVRHLRFNSTIIIGSNDIELLPTINWIREQGVRVEIFTVRPPKLLMQSVDYCREISNDLLEFKTASPAQ
jgi:uncharacterized LabA/DUF88 family protein